jgi:hypothetical protein
MGLDWPASAPFANAVSIIILSNKSVDNHMGERSFNINDNGIVISREDAL